MKLIKRLINKLKKRTGETKYDVLVRYSDVAVKATALLKKFTDGKVDNFIVSQIPGEVDDAALAILEQHLPKFAAKTAILNSILHAGQDSSDPIVAIAKHINGLHLEGKEEFYAKFAARLTLDIAKAKEDGEFTLAEGFVITQARFLELKAEGII